MALATSQPFTTNSELAVDCKRCRSTYLVAYQLPVSANAPEHCPMCPAHTSTATTNGWCTYRPKDLADILVLDNVGFTRHMALKALEFQAQLVLYQKPGYTLSIQELLVKYEVATMRYPYADAYTPLHVSCTSCGGTFEMLRGNPVPQQTPPLHCVWCGNKTLSIDPLGTEDSAWLALAAQYDLPINLTKKLYNHWSQRNTHTYFADFIEANADDIMILRASLAAKQAKGATTND